MRYYYVYQYLRKEDRTPYYIGRGSGSRLLIGNHNIHLPEDLSFIEVIAEGLTYQESRKLEISLIAKYGRKNNGTGILRNLTDGAEGRPVYKDSLKENKPAKEILAEAALDRKNKETIQNQKNEEKEKQRTFNLIEKQRKKEEGMLKKIKKNEEKEKLKEVKKQQTAKKREEILRHKLDLIKEGGINHPICPYCRIKPVAISYYKYGRVYYKNKCSQCLRKGIKKLPPAGWIRSGYKKKDKCEKCNFRFKHPEQSHVYHLDGNTLNNDWINLRTICSNCSVEIRHSNLPWKADYKGGITPDY